MAIATLFKVTFKPATNTKSSYFLVQRMDLNDKAEAIPLDHGAPSLVRGAIMSYAKKRGDQWWMPANEDDLHYVGDEKNGRVTYYVTYK
jgi:hypothetical protein